MGCIAGIESVTLCSQGQKNARFSQKSGEQAKIPIANLSAFIDSLSSESTKRMLSKLSNAKEAFE
jgi:hypothetical protein